MDLHYLARNLTQNDKLWTVMDIATERNNRHGILKATHTIIPGLMVVFPLKRTTNQDS